MIKFLDADVHVRWPSNEILMSRLPRSWQDRFLNGAGHTQSGLRLNAKHYHPVEFAQTDCVGSPGAQDPAKLREDWMTPHGIDAAILSVYDACTISTFGDVDYPIELARAVNDWMAEEWLQADDRFFGTIVVATQNPTTAAEEIRRVASKHPRMVQVMLPNGTRQPYGHGFYHPIYQAAVEFGLVIAVHGGTEGLGTSCPPSPNGNPGNWLEWKAAASTVFLAHLTSLVTEGVFTRFPELRVVALETGVAFLAPYLWRFDKNYKGLRSECPWLKELPTEAVRRYFRFGTQGAEPANPPSEFWRLMHSIEAEDLLVYSSNSPRWDAEVPDNSFVLKNCPPQFVDGIRAENALRTYPRLKD